MADADRIRRTYLTGRQSAHLTFMPRKLPANRDPDRDGPPPMPDASVVSWEIHEQLCEPYAIKAVVFASASFPERLYWRFRPVRTGMIRRHSLVYCESFG